MPFVPMNRDPQLSLYGSAILKHRPPAPAPQQAVPMRRWRRKNLLLKLILNERAPLGPSAWNGIDPGGPTVFRLLQAQCGPAPQMGMLPLMTEHELWNPNRLTPWFTLMKWPSRRSVFIEGQKNEQLLAQVRVDD